MPGKEIHPTQDVSRRLGRPREVSRIVPESRDKVRILWLWVLVVNVDAGEPKLRLDVEADAPDRGKGGISRFCKMRKRRGQHGKPGLCGETRVNPRLLWGTRSSDGEIRLGSDTVKRDDSPVFQRLRVKT